MKKLFFLGLFALVSLVGFSQPLKEFYPQNAYLVFRPAIGDKVDAYYKIPDLKIFVNSSGVGERIEINSRLELSGFAWTQSISNNVYDFISPTEQDKKPETKPKPDKDYNVGRTQLKIPGYDDISDIYLADESLKQRDDSKLNIQLATHSISQGQNIGNKRSRVNYKIVDQYGKVWVEVIQKDVTVEGYLGGKFGNNHPDKTYLRDLIEDCNVYLPLGLIYTIEMRNEGELMADFWVMHPWSQDGQERRLHREDIPPNQERYYTIDTNGLAGMKSFERTIKINNNGR